MQVQPDETMPAYKYDAVSEAQFRIFLLSPAKRYDDDLYGRLQPHSLEPSRKNDIPAYEALSYVWGSPQSRKQTLTLLQDPVPGVLDGDKTKSVGTLQIGQSLVDALRNLRYKEKPRILWIDAICINQVDLDERSRQVKRMGDIYRNAELVVVFLAPASDDLDRALEIVRHLSTVYDLSTTNELDRIRTSDPNFAFGQPLPYDVDDWLCLYQFFGLSWFRRVWIRQEIILAKEAVMMIGKEELDWATFCGVSLCVKTKMWQFPSPLGEGLGDELEEYMINIFQLQNLKPFKTFSQFISRTGISECQDPRDRVYSILDLCDLDITPNYEKNEREVHVEAFLNHTSHIKDLRLLLFCNMAEKPSWAPDFSKPTSNLLLEAPSFACGDPTLSTPQTLSHQDDSKNKTPSDITTIAGVGFKLQSYEELQVEAVHCGKVEWRTEPMPHRPTGEAVKRTIRSWILEAVANGIQTYDSYMTDALIRAITFGHIKGEWIDVMPTVEQFKDILMHDVEGYRPPPTLATQNKARSYPPRQIFNILKILLPGTTLFRMSGDRFALGFGDFRAGDDIYVIKGCPKPMILRPEEEGKYTVIGACVAPHLSRGEAFLGQMPQGWQMKLNGHDVWQACFVGPDGDPTLEDPRLNPLLQRPFEPRVEKLTLV